MEISLYDFQSASIDALRTNIVDGRKNLILAAPTGSGKTVCAAYLLDECYKKRGEKPKRAVFVADRIALVDQTSAVLDRYGIPHGIIQADHWRQRPWERIQVASAQTLARRGWPQGCDLIIVDEAHTAYAATLKRIAARDCVTIGLTATPFTKGLGKHYDGVVSVTTTNRLIADGTLSPYRIFAASEPDMKGAKTVAGEWTDAEAEKRSMPIIGDCVAEYLRHGDGKKFIAFGVTVAHCEEIQRQFLASGVHCALYTHQTPDSERRLMVQEFRKPDSYIRGLISVAALAKGFDVSDVEVVIMCRPLRSSLAEHIQILGRGLRSHPGKTICTVLDHSGNCVRFWDRMQDFFENGASVLDDGKRKEKKKREAPEKEPRKCPRCHSVHAPRPTCPACGFQYPSTNGVRHQPGELRELSGSGATRDQKQDVYSQLVHMARYGRKPRSMGWVANTYRERFGVWPRDLSDRPKPPTTEIENWVRSRLIAYAQRMKQAGK